MRGPTRISSSYSNGLGNCSAEITPTSPTLVRKANTDGDNVVAGLYTIQIPFDARAISHDFTGGDLIQKLMRPGYPDLLHQP